MQGKVCLITGATSGIGKAATLELARRGATVVGVGRNPAKCEATTRQIEEATGNRPDFLLADLSSQADVRRLGAAFLEKHDRLDVLVNNAGAINLSHRKTVDGLELTFALNHLAYFLLTLLLLDVLKASAPSRVINVSSTAHERAGINIDDLADPLSYSGFVVYSQSKLANLLFTYEATRRFDGEGVTFNALHPGLVGTNLLSSNGLRGRIGGLFLRAFGRGVSKGARTIVYLATTPEVEGVTSKYFVDERAVGSSAPSYDEGLATELWELSSRLTSL
jgi:NAD(P)-dependent dehydrogenase (short-subunit alcohol dehydrogenase family)